MVEGGAPQVGDHALAGAHHQVEAQPGRAGERGGEHQQRHQRLVEQARLAAAETAVDHQAQPLAERQHAARGDDQGEQRRGDAPAIRREEAREPRRVFHRA